MLCSKHVEDRHHRFASGVPLFTSVRDDSQTAIECPSIVARHGCGRCRRHGSPSGGHLPKAQLRQQPSGLCLKRNRLEKRTGLFVGSPCKEHPGEPHSGLRIVGVRRQGLSVQTLRLVQRAHLFGFFGRFEPGDVRSNLIEEPADRLLWLDPDELRYNRTIPEGLHRRDALDAEHPGQGGVGVDIYLRQHEAPVVLCGETLEDGAEDPTGLAPIRPEVDDHRNLTGSLEHAGLEVLLSHVNGCLRCHRHHDTQPGAKDDGGANGGLTSRRLVAMNPILTVMLVLGLLAAPSTVASTRMDPIHREPVEFSAARAFEHVRTLAGRIGPRPAGSAAYGRAARYVRRAFVKLGYRARLVPFELPNGSTSRNVVATWPGPARRRVLIGAHLDTVPDSPGANDNASGVAVVLELARVFAGTREADGIRFVAFGAEEVQPGGGHHFGSAAYAERARPRAMVSVDMIGLDRLLIVGWLGIGKRRTVAALLRSAKDTGVHAREEVLPDWSDNGPFERAGVPAAFLWTGDEPNHHRPTDVVGNVAKPALLRAGTVLIRFVTVTAGDGP